MERKGLRQEPEITRLLYNKAMEKRIPLGGTFELSPICNFSCRMCYVRKTQKEVSESPRPLLTGKQWLELAKELKKEGMLYLLLTGGEPFLYPDFWELYEELMRMGFVISINSNGSLITEKVVERLRKNPPTRINITLYGASDETYESLCGVKGVFTKVDQAITMLKNAGIDVKLNCSLTPQNAADLEKIVAYAEERKLIVEIATYMFPPLRRDETLIGKNERFTPEEAAYYNIERFRLQYDEETYQHYLENLVKNIIPPLGLLENCMESLDGKMQCRAAKASFWITWDGWLTPCGMMNEPKIDVLEQPFKESWQKLMKANESLILNGVCGKCSNQKICSSCAAMSLAETGSFSGIPRYLCEQVAAARRLAKERLEENNK